MRFDFLTQFSHSSSLGEQFGKRPILEKHQEVIRAAALSASSHRRWAEEESGITREPATYRRCIRRLETASGPNRPTYPFRSVRAMPDRKLTRSATADAEFRRSGISKMILGRPRSRRPL